MLAAVVQVSKFEALVVHSLASLSIVRGCLLGVLVSERHAL